MVGNRTRQSQTNDEVMKSIEMSAPNTSDGVLAIYTEDQRAKMVKKEYLKMRRLFSDLPLDRKRMLTKARETARLYDGREVVGRVLATWVRGRCVYSNGSADATARGWGQWLRHSGACASANAEYMN